MLRSAFSIVIWAVLTLIPAQAMTRFQTVQFGDWVLVCTTGSPCDAEVRPKDGELAPSANASPEPNGSLDLEFILPPEAGTRLTVVVAENDMSMHLLKTHVCSDVCKVYWHILKDDVAKMLEGTNLTVVYALTENDSSQFVLPLDGLKETIEFLQKSSK